MWIEQLLITFKQDVFLSASGLLIIGFVFGRLVNIVRLPRVTGYIIAGIIFGPSLLNIFSKNDLAQFDFIPQLALGIIALVIGSGLKSSLAKS